MLSVIPSHLPPSSLFFFNDTATTEIYTLSLHDALPISQRLRPHPPIEPPDPQRHRSGAEGRTTQILLVGPLERQPADGGDRRGVREQRAGVADERHARAAQPGRPRRSRQRVERGLRGERRYKKDVERSEERRVGKECRSRWSP